MEKWKPIPGYEAWYEVSDKGRVAAVERVVTFSDGRVRRYARRVLRLKLHEGGYPMAALCRNGFKRWVTVHSCVLLAFVGSCPPGKQVCHNNGRSGDSRLSNLRYDTPKGNAADTLKHGTRRQGATHQSAVFSGRKVAAVKRAVGTTAALARRFGMSRTHVWNIQNGMRRHVG